ncbi:hypothetical protein L1A08_17565 [Rubinisphaera sp. ICM_H10]|nr:hypothetical protein [Rubinisphaera margarita]
MVVVVLVMGIISSVAAVKMFEVSTDAKVNAMATTFADFVRAAELRKQIEGGYFKDSPTGTLPPELAAFIRPEQWEAVTPINGKWDVEKNTFAIKRALGIHFIAGSGPMPDSSILQQIDAVIDDGNISTGSLRLLDTDRFYYVLHE